MHEWKALSLATYAEESVRQMQAYHKAITRSASRRSRHPLYDAVNLPNIYTRLFSPLGSLSGQSGMSD